VVDAVDGAVVFRYESNPPPPELREEKKRELN
jgi:hypothetical protein